MIRSFTNDDATYVVDAHYEIYHREYGYDDSFKAFISQSVGDFIRTADTGKDMVVNW